MMRRRNGLIATLGVASVLVVTQTAFAHGGDVKTKDPAPGGVAHLIHSGGGSNQVTHYIQACDLQADGKGVKAYVSFNRGGRQNMVHATKGSGTCSARRKVVTRGKPVYVTVCLTRGKTFCRTRLFR